MARCALHTGLCGAPSDGIVQFRYLKMLVRLVDKPLFSNLKHLTLCGELIEFDLNKLNRFRQLLQLEVEFSGKVNFNFPKLKVLTFHWFNADCTPVQVVAL